MNKVLNMAASVTSEGSTEQAERSYAEYTVVKELAFDPMKDLNLPGSYKEVLDRLERLQVDRTPGALN